MSDKTIEELIEASSFGTPEAKAARESVPHSTGSAIALAAKYLGRAKAAERKVAAVEALADEWDRVSWGGEDHIRTCTCVRDPLHPELPRCARCIVAEAAMDLRAALDTDPSG